MRVCVLDIIESAIENLMNIVKDSKIYSPKNIIYTMYIHGHRYTHVCTHNIHTYIHIHTYAHISMYFFPKKDERFRITTKY